MSPADALRLSSFARVVPAGRWWIVANVATPSRLIVDAPLAKAVQAFGERPLTAAQFAAGCPEQVDADALLSLLLDHGIVVARDHDETASLGELIAGDDPPATAEKPLSARYRTPRPLRADELQAPATHSGGLRALEVLMIGGCVVAFAQDTLIRLGRRRGLSVTCRHRWPSTRRLAPLDADGASPDLVVLQPTIEAYLTGVWDDGPLQAPALRTRHVHALARLFARMIDELAARLDGRLGLVHNVAPPSVSPFGRLDFRIPTNFREIAAELNAAIDEQARHHESLMIVDEERLALRHGGARLFDELLFPFGHHGGAADPATAQAHQLPLLSDVLAEEYLACYETFHGLGRVRCVAVDLDGVLWPGVLAEDGMGWVESDTTTRWMHLGLHQALRLLKSRGILLVSLSRGSADVTLEAWRRGGDPRLLSPEDFALHSIEWTPKSERLRSIAQRLGLQPHDVLLLDDSPAERAELRARLPETQIADREVADFRALLLSDPRCEAPWRTEETARRTETTRMALQREALRDTLPEADFLASLDVCVALEPLRPEQRARACELLTRTTQFNTLGRLLLRDEAMRTIEGPGVRAIGVRVTDRFGDHGLCGIVVTEGQAVNAVVLSCRVIGLEVAVPMLVGSLRLTQLLRPGTSAHVAKVPRNAPCHDLFSRAGFTQCDDGRFEIVDVAAVERSARIEHMTVTLGEHGAASATVAA